MGWSLYVFSLIILGVEVTRLIGLLVQASSTVTVTPARSLTALALSLRTGVRSPRSALSSLTTSRLSSKRLSRLVSFSRGSLIDM